MAKKVTVGYAALTSCSGCEIALLDINEKILDVLKNVELVYGPLVMDAREVPDDIDLLFVEGSVSTDHDLQQTKEYRKKAKYLVAVGACAVSGGFYRNYATVQGIDRIIPVDAYIPGCPPRPEMIIDGIIALQEKIRKSKQYF